MEDPHPNKRGSLPWILSGAFVLVYSPLLISSLQKSSGQFIFLIIIGTLGLFLIWRWATLKYRRRKKILATEFPPAWRKILTEKVIYYNHLPASEKPVFEKDIQIFLAEKRITGIKTRINDTDRLLVSASAVIPVFRFRGWEYRNLSEVLLYPGSFDEQYDTGHQKFILGMVGTGAMDRMMILSQQALRQGFAIANDKKNVGIHEFTHLIDMTDGVADGLPEVLLQNQYAIPWLNLVEEEMEKIFNNQSGINPYGATNKQEFFAVVSEYFFEQPHLLKQKHPEIYVMLEKIFSQKGTERLPLNFKKRSIGRNSPCPCGSGKKFKHCCGKNN
ncbi:MAG: zinc-dependent peptidase [Bacteroides sp.]|nr:zinc-dependent peptidase [Bacteroides sp.]